MRIKRARERGHMKQEDLARAVGVNIKTVDNWENGRSRPKNRMGALEQVLGDWGFAPDQVDSTDTVGNPPAGAQAVVRQIIEVLDSRFSPAVQVQMIREVIQRDFVPATGTDSQDRLAG
jgi:transcriptional regulator with XRE-family HTH domain